MRSNNTDDQITSPFLFLVIFRSKGLKSDIKLSFYIKCLQKLHTYRKFTLNTPLGQVDKLQFFPIGLRYIPPVR